MANQCINQVVLTGEREALLHMISQEYFHYTKNDIHELNQTTFCVIFSSDWDPPTEELKRVSSKAHEIQFDIYYADKLTQRVGLITIIDGYAFKDDVKLSLTLNDLKKPLTSRIFNGLKRYNCR